MPIIFMNLPCRAYRIFKGVVIYRRSRSRRQRRLNKNGVFDGAWGVSTNKQKRQERESDFCPFWAGCAHHALLAISNPNKSGLRGIEAFSPFTAGTLSAFGALREAGATYGLKGWHQNASLY
jgi:hypothetical protein